MSSLNRVVNPRGNRSPKRPTFRSAAFPDQPTEFSPTSKSRSDGLREHFAAIELSSATTYGAVDLGPPAEPEGWVGRLDQLEQRQTDGLVRRLQVLYTLYGLSVCWGAYLTLWETTSLGWSATTVGRVQASIAVSVMLCAPLFSAALDILSGRSSEWFVLGCFALNGVMHAGYALGLTQLGLGMGPIWGWVLGAEVMRGSCCALIDAFCIARLGQDKLQYGRVRMCNSLTWGFGAAAIGAVQLADLSPIFLLSPVFITLLTGYYGLALSSPSPMAAHHSVEVPAKQPVEPADDSPRASYYQTLSQFFEECDRRMLLELVAVLLVLGSARRAFEYFLFLRIVQLPGGTTAMMGAATLIQTLSEIPAYWYFAGVNQRLGTRGVLYLCSCCYIARALVYAQAPQAWMVLLVEPLHGITFALLYSNIIIIAAEVAPKELSGTSQGLLVRGAFEGIGGLTGSVVGGIVFDYSPRVLFNSIAVVVAIMLTVMAILDTMASWRAASDSPQSSSDFTRIPIDPSEITGSRYGSYDASSEDASKPWKSPL